MQPDLDVAQRLYEAFADHDAEKLLSLLHPEFEGVVSAGLPNDFGGTYHGPEAMLADCWARVFQVFDIRPVPTDFLETSDGSVVVLGSYLGNVRGGGEHPLDAAFAHVLSFRDGFIARLIQITDSALWVKALPASRLGPTHTPGADSTSRT